MRIIISNRLNFLQEFHFDRIHCSPAVSLNMAEGRMNLAALQQRDPFITEILDTASQVALYSFNSKTNEWVCIIFFTRQLLYNTNKMFLLNLFCKQQHSLVSV